MSVNSPDPPGPLGGRHHDIFLTRCSTTIPASEAAAQESSTERPDAAGGERLFAADGSSHLQPYGVQHGRVSSTQPCSPGSQHPRGRELVLHTGQGRQIQLHVDHQ